MLFKPPVRQLAFLLHVVCSVGWLGAVGAYLALAVSGLTTHHEMTARGAYASMETIAKYVVLPASSSALATGIVVSLGTRWGLFRHYWVVAKLLLATTGTAILLGHMRSVTRMASMANQTPFHVIELGRLPMQLVVHAAGGLALLMIITVISVFKPWGKTPFAR